MNQGIMLYALNNEEIDYVEIAYHAALQAKKHLNLPVAIVTDSADWLYQKFPDYKEVFDIVIKVVHETTVEPWRSNQYYGIGNLAYHNGTIWRKVKDGKEVVNVINKEFKEKRKFEQNNYDPVYEGIDIDKWYPNLPYLAGQHVWYENTLYRCHTDYEEQDEFSINQYDILLENVYNFTSDMFTQVGDIILFDRTLWMQKKEIVKSNIKEIILNEKFFDRVYEGIDIDKWYPNLPYLKGQHVWYENTLYRCHTDYEEQDEFSFDQYDVLLKNIKDIGKEDLTPGDIILHNRVLWIHNDYSQKIDFDESNFSRVYEGIDVDKWYPNLPYLKGQHVWYNDILYRCHTDYEEKDEFSINQYDILLENVYDFNNVNNILLGGEIYLHNRVLWLSHIDIKEETKFQIIEKEKIKKVITEFDESNFNRIYEGIDIDKWYPNLPYLKGQHVWYNNILYRCEISYTEGNVFSKDKYIVLLENIFDLEITENFNKGDKFLYNRVLWQSNINEGVDLEIVSVWYDLEDLERVYQGIDIDKWYPNLPYLAGQHVWHNDILYRCHTDYEEKDEFSLDNYDVLLENIKDLTSIEKFNTGDVLLYNRVLWMSKVNFDGTLNENKIRDDIWEDTKERHFVYNPASQYRKYFDGAMSNKRLKFKNDIRIKSYELSPFNETLIIDCDYFINNDTLKYCWQQPHDFLIFKEAVDLAGYRYDPRLHTLSDKSIDFYWATVFFFRKTKNTEIFFNYLGHIQENWNYYRYVYQIQNSMYRNDFAFSIAIHVMNGYQEGTWAHNLPGKLYYVIDKDVFIEYNDIEMKFLIEKEKYKGEYTLLKTKGLNVHVMNKFSISRILKEVEHV